MKVLKDRILKDGRCLEGGTLKVDSFINHQMDPVLMEEMAKEFVRRFSDVQVDKVLTVESSGIAPAIMVGALLKKPVVFAKKSRPSTMDNVLVSKVFSFTKNREYEICMNRSFLASGESVLFIDDFLANGNAAKGIMDLADQAGASIVGAGFIIEKAFQDGGDMLRRMGVRVESLAIIESLDNCEIRFKEVPILNSHNKEEYPPMHTAEHILNATMVDMFGCPRSRNAHIERKKSKCDYALDVAPSEEQIAEIEARVNDVIEKELDVSVEFMSREQASKIVDLGKLPEDVSSILRIVKVGDYDSCACIGTHVSNTKEIGRFKILSHSFADGIWRVRWKVRGHCSDAHNQRPL